MVMDNGAESRVYLDQLVWGVLLGVLGAAGAFVFVTITTLGIKLRGAREYRRSGHCRRNRHPVHAGDELLAACGARTPRHAGAVRLASRRAFSKSGRTPPYASKR